MEIRSSNIDTPLSSFEPEHIKRRERLIPFQIIPDKRIKVFISSICGIEKYETVRAELKKVIEATGLADVYLFEEEDASTLPAEAHYSLALEDSDICIFLIDNADGISLGVQAEIDIVKKKNIKALYYFCDENSAEKTPLEQSLMGANFAKSKTIHKFIDLSKDCATALINDMITIYRYYCKHKIVLSSIADVNDFQHVDIADTEKLQAPIIPKMVLRNIDRCKKYVLNLGYCCFLNDSERSGDIDEWCDKFLPILFEGQSINNFNTGMFLEILKEQQTDKHHQVVQIRWQAIQAYFASDITKCIRYLEDALKAAKKTDQPAWLIKDILIDLRNQNLILDTMNNRYLESEAQRELLESSEDIYYPILDRINESLHEKYIEGLYDEKTKSPYAITIGSGLEQYGELLASAYIVSMYNGSLSHILLLYKKIKNFLFYLSCRFNDWDLRRDLLKLAIFQGDDKEIKGIQDSYPEILNDLNAVDAMTIMKFCDNHPVKYERFISELRAFGTVGYYLCDEDYRQYEIILLNKIKEWLNDSNPIFIIGENIFRSLSGVSYRMSQNVLAEICCMFIEKNCCRWFTEMFKFMANNMNLRKMSMSSAEQLIKYIIKILENDGQRKHIQYAPRFLCTFRKQDRALTEELDKKVAEYFPEYYNGDYKLETIVDQAEYFPERILSYLQRIRHSNDTQGMKGTYFLHSTRDIAIIRSLLLTSNIKPTEEIMSFIISTVADTLLVSKENVSTKLDAVSLLICIILKYGEDYKRDIHTFEELIEKKENIKTVDNNSLFFNNDSISLEISMQFLFCAMGIDTCAEILELMPYIQDNIATTISVTRIISEYLEVTDQVVFPKKIETVVLQNVLQWLCSNQMDIRWNATRILLKMARNPENSKVVNHRLISLVDSENVFIKNLVLRNIYKESGITEKTRNYIFSKCEHDANFVVRMVCKEEISKNTEM